tara:strand:+ start:5127 stop:5810 length:684 start_codon:yes stop_codon:yes gene_type:complete
MFRLVIFILISSSIYGQVFDPQTGEEIKPQFDPQTGRLIERKNKSIINNNISNQLDNYGNTSNIEFKKQDLILRNGGKKIRIKENQKIYVNGHLKIYEGIDYSNKLIKLFNTSNQDATEKIISFDNIINIRYTKLLTTPTEKGDYFAFRGGAIGSLFTGGAGFLLGVGEDLECAIVLGGLGLLSGGVSGLFIGYIYGIITAAHTVVYSNFSKPIQIGPEDWQIESPD